MSNDGNTPASGELCVCFHVTTRQIVKFLRHHRPQVASQCSECYGAGTGCGWCVPFIEKLFEEFQAGNPRPAIDIGPEEYRRRRAEHLERIRADRTAPAEPDNQPPETPPGDGEPLVDQILPDT